MTYSHAQEFSRTTGGILVPRRPTFEELRALAHPMGRPKSGSTTVRATEILASSPQHDPFYVGIPWRMAEANWFAKLWADYGKPGDHVRRIHYRVIHQRERSLLMPDGSPYFNTEECYAFLQRASCNARYARLVAAHDFTDQRNPDPEIFAQPRYFDTEPGIELDSVDAAVWSLPYIQPAIAARFDSIPTPTATGYNYQPHDQPYLLEVWIEKSTMQDVLLPICRRNYMNLITGVGRLSITRVIQMLYRVARDGRPARIFYISDFDPSGDSMPAQVARQAELFMADYAPDADIKLQHLALTSDQVRKWDLPRTPIKGSDPGRARFEARHGSGAVELDALEAIVPGELARLVEDAIEPYIDPDLPRRLDDAKDEADQAIAEDWAQMIETEEIELQAIAAEASEIAKPFQDELLRLNRDLQRKLAPLRDRLDVVRQQVRLKAADFRPDLPERPEPEPATVDESEVLFDSARDYWEQLRFYKERRAS